MNAKPPNIQVPEQYQKYVFQALHLLKRGSIGTAHGVISAVQWAFVLVLGFAAGLALYMAILSGLTILMKKQLKKRQLYRDVTIARAKLTTQAELIDDAGVGPGPGPGLGSGSQLKRGLSRVPRLRSDGSQRAAGGNQGGHNGSQGGPSGSQGGPFQEAAKGVAQQLAQGGEAVKSAVGTAATAPTSTGAAGQAGQQGDHKAGGTGEGKAPVNIEEFRNRQ